MKLSSNSQDEVHLIKEYSKLFVVLAISSKCKVALHYLSVIMGSQSQYSSFQEKQFLWNF